MSVPQADKPPARCPCGVMAKAATCAVRAAAGASPRLKWHQGGLAPRPQHECLVSGDLPKRPP